MEVNQSRTRVRYKSGNTASLFNILSKLDNIASSNNSSGVTQTRTRMRVRTDGKSKGIAIRKK